MNQNLDDFIDDEPFLHVTYEAVLQVEKFKALKQAKKAMRTGTGPPARDRKKDGQTRNSDTTRKDKEKEKEPRGATCPANPKTERIDEGGSPENWTFEIPAIERVPQGKQQAHRANKGCFRCGWTGHRAVRCYAGSTKEGTNLPPVP